MTHKNNHQIHDIPGKPWTLLHYFLPECFCNWFFSKNQKFEKIEAVAWECSVKKVFHKISQNSQENSCARVSLGLQLY